MTKKVVRREVGEAPSPFPDSIHPVLRRVYAARGITSPQELARTFDNLHSYSALFGVDKAVALLVEALRTEQRILIVGDFDADGATSCATAVRGLRMLGARHVDYVVPNRFEFGYGLTPEIVEVARDYQPDLIVTVDNGISSVEGVAAAHEQGIKVLITDHHLPGAVLPAADAIVNPNQPDCPFPSKHLAGVGVIFYVLLGLRTALRQQGWFEEQGCAEPNLADLLDLVALGTVADVVPLDQSNRILVAQGLKRIQAGRCCPGIDRLLTVAGRNRERVVATDLGFAVGPRLNAAGRLEDMSLGIECLLTDDPAVAARYAKRLDQLNRERREIEAEMKEQAMAFLSETELASADEDSPVGVCLFDESWHQGVIGILASRIKEKLHRPVIAFAAAGDNEIKGSARSIPGLHIRDALDGVATGHPGLITKFGGHAMAAGLTVKRDRLDEFRAAFDAQVREQLTEEDLQGVIYSDGELQEGELSLDVAEALRDGGPWGQGFPEPVFDGVFEVVNRRIVGEHHLKLQLRLPGGQRPIDGIAFNTTDEDWDGQPSHVEVAYKLDVNEYNGRRMPQLLVEHIQPRG